LPTPGAIEQEIPSIADKENKNRMQKFSKVINSNQENYLLSADTNANANGGTTYKKTIRINSLKFHHDSHLKQVFPVLWFRVLKC